MISIKLIYLGIPAKENQHLTILELQSQIKASDKLSPNSTAEPSVCLSKLKFESEYMKIHCRQKSEMNQINNCVVRHIQELN